LHRIPSGQEKSPADFGEAFRFGRRPVGLCENAPPIRKDRKNNADDKDELREHLRQIYHARATHVKQNP
jgi:hypothetical protein